MHFSVKNLSLLRSKTLFSVGAVFLIIGFIFLAGTFLPLVIASLTYHFFPGNSDATVVAQAGQLDPQKQYIIARDSEFGIVIPKINANARIVADVDPYRPEIYQTALTHGVAQAAGTAVPTQPGTMFLFAHSAGDITQALRYNAVFYLLDKLQKDDSIYVFYKNQKYRYVVTRTEVVDPNQVKYLSMEDKEKKLILMTCTPAGTTRKRLLVHAQMVASE